MSNVKYRFSEDGLVAYGELASGQIFVIDADMVEKIRTVKFYLGSKGEVLQTQSRNQIIKWLKNPHSDSAEYKMWGNGVALPNVYFVLSGIVYYSQFPDFLL